MSVLAWDWGGALMETRFRFGASWRGINFLPGQSGIEVRTVSARDGQVDAERLIDAIDERTQLVTMPTVTFSPGFRAGATAVGRVLPRARHQSRS